VYCSTHTYTDASIDCAAHTDTYECTHSHHYHGAYT
jgi:hypothetical protein